jgi:hypothetical protein
VAGRLRSAECGGEEPLDFVGGERDQPGVGGRPVGWARLLLQRGVRVDKLWQACHGGQRWAAERLAPAEAAADLGTQRENLITWLHGQKPDRAGQ